MRTIRPWQFFEKLKGNHDILYRIPSHRGIESETVMSLETMLLIAAARMVDTKTILEFGTSLGYTALQLSRNLDAEIVTVDRTKRNWVFPDDGKVLPCTMELEDVIPTPFDMVFCDINYTLSTITIATEIAFACKPKVVAWHDYGHPLNPHVKPFLDGLDKELIHVEDSWMVFWFGEDLWAM